MEEPYYKVNGVNIISFLEDEGLKFEENDLDSEDSGRTLDGVMHRGKIASKDKHTLRFRILNTAESNTIHQLLSSFSFVTVVTNIHPKYGTVSKQMYNSSRFAAVFRVGENGDAIWKDISMTLIER